MDERPIKQRVLKELNMTEEQLEEVVTTLMSWLLYQPHLPHGVDKVALKSFIIGCKSTELAKKKLQNYLMSRSNFPEIANLDPFKIDWDKIQLMAYLPELTPEGYQVFFLTLPNINELPDFNFIDSLRFWLMMTEVLMRERPFCTGLIILADLKNFSVKLFTKISISILPCGLYFLEEANPFSLKAIYNFNSPQGIDFLNRTLFKPLVNEKVYNMVETYTEDERSITKHIPNKILPSDYGGEAPPLAEIMKNWKLKLENRRSLFMEELAELPDPSKMPADLKEDSRFGTSGTFRKLDID